ncbi:MAG TPA: D-alanyl-D-alanine carboxypeptidase/D-alanyl-D-alanine-endopeptidase [Burkholderiales bacterium]|nr:D-alanyl-D-alanine carboxypeptidase/D-alanyl-D-alanine-endopeptidase [Burkholderiales bacterium]
MSRICLLPLLILLAAMPVRAQSTPGDIFPPEISAALGQAGIPESDVGVYVRNLSSDREVLAVNADRPMNPASVMKLVTTFAALELLGPAYKWQTQAWIDGLLENGRLEGNLALKGYGDPKFDIERLWAFLRELRHRGIREITGDLLLDRSYFATGPHDPSLFDNEPSRPYNVGPDALLLNDKSFRLQFVPDVATRSVEIFSEPVLPQILVVNKLELGAGGCDSWPEKASIADDVMYFSGIFPAACGEKFRYFSLLAPDEYAQTLFRQIWEQVGGTWTGRARPAAVPSDATLFATSESAPLADLMREVNKYSINVMARQIYLTLGARDDPPATLEKSRSAIDNWLMNRHLSFPELAIENGAGLSRTDRISSRHLGDLLAAAYRSPLMPEFVASLSLTSVDGTMKKRLANSPAAARSHVKTGYVDGVRAIAGYTLNERADVIAIVMLINHAEARNAQAAQDALLEWAHADPAK